MFTKGVQARIFFKLTKQSNGDDITDEDIGSVSVFVTTGTEGQANSTNPAVYNGNGQWYVDLTASEMDANNIGVFINHPLAIGISLNIPTTGSSVVYSGGSSSVSTGIPIADMANSPKRTRTVEGTVEERDIKELIDADQYLLQKQASEAVPWGIRVAKTRAGGTVN